MEPAPRQDFAIAKTRTRFLGLTLDECIKVFFGGNAFMAVVVLALITIFLFKEGVGFFGQNQQNLEVYRKAGLEYVEFARQEEQDHTALNRYLFDIRLRALQHYTKVDGLSLAEANDRVYAFDDYAYGFSDTVDPLRGLARKMTDIASATKTAATIAEDRKEQRAQLLAAGKPTEAAAVEVLPVDYDGERKALMALLPVFHDMNVQFAEAMESAITAPLDPLPTAELQTRLSRFKELTRDYIAGFPATEARMADWDPNEPVSLGKSFSSFILGTDWLTASFWQDWYGVVPLFVGSLMVSIVALVIAVPLGVGAAVYTNQIATVEEQRFIKPCIEFISAIPSVVLGFFGIVVLGEAIRNLSEVTWLNWLPGFPIAERLNALTAGVLLALIAIPTIFTLAEDALNNVPRAYKEASFALGATRWQTIIKIILPASLSGIISAILLGLGRVIGETMVVLLCAGNRIAIPDFSTGLAAFTQPVHTMTGIIAQEMGEVVRDGIHYRALFVVGMLLFIIALTINFFAQKIVQRYRISIG